LVAKDANYNFQNILHILPRVMKTQTHSTHMVQLVQDTVPEASFTSTS